MSFRQSVLKARLLAGPIAVGLTLAGRVVTGGQPGEAPRAATGAAGPAAVVDKPSPDSYRKLAAAAEAMLRDDVLNVWFPRAVDREHGGFRADWARDWSRAPSSGGKFSVFQARMTWTSSQIAMQRPALKDRFLPLAKHGYAYLKDILWDKQSGGFFWGLDDYGKISPYYTDGKHLYGNSFCLYALGAYHRATRDPAALELAQRTFRWIDQHGHDAKNGGYFEWLSRDGQPVVARPETGRVELTPVAQFPAGYKSMNTHIHLLEAFTELYLSWKDDTVRRRIEELVAIIRDKISAAPGAMNLYLTNDWVALPDHDSYGHDVEAAYLMLEAEEVLGRGHQAATERMAKMLVDHALAYGWDQNLGGFFRDGTTYGAPEDKQKEWWVQAEGLNALLLMHEKYGQGTDKYFKSFEKQWRFIVDHQRDPEFHGLYELVDGEGRPVAGGKGRIWKECYHEGRALLNVIARLQRLATTASGVRGGNAGGAAAAASAGGAPRGATESTSVGTEAKSTSVGTEAGAMHAAPVAKFQTRAAVLARLARLNQSPRFLFGQENATLWGMYRDGGLISTGPWFEATARSGHFTSDSEAMVGDHPAVLGVSLGMLALEPTDWNRRAAVAGAMRKHLIEGGVVTMDWHAPSCNAGGRPGGKSLATINVGGVDVAIQAIPGGSSFYAEDEYTHPVTSLADVPDTLKCLCQIANDLPLTAGAYQGTTGKTWLVAHAKHAAAVLREQGLEGAPIIVRPFHEQNGSWFWWGQPYWACVALLGKPDAVSGPEAYKEMVRTFVSALRSEPGMENLIFAYSPDRLLGTQEKEDFSAVEYKVTDPGGYARDLLREQLLRELGAAGLAYTSPAQQRATLGASEATSVKRADTYVAQRRPFYAEAYAGDDVFDVLGIDLYHPMARAAAARDLRLFRLQLRVLAEEARVRRKPYALTEAGTYRMHLAQVAQQGRAAAPGQTLIINGKKSVDEALERLFDPVARAALLKHFGLATSGPIALDDAERAAVLPKSSEDWYNRQLLVLAKESKVAYALVWQTYYDAAATDRYAYYYVPYPGHPEAPSFKRFYSDPATCFLHDSCGR